MQNFWGKKHPSEYSVCKCQTWQAHVTGTIADIDLCTLRLTAQNRSRPLWSVTWASDVLELKPYRLR